MALLTKARPVTRKTERKYRFTLTGAQESPSGKQLVVTLLSDQFGDFIELRESGRRARMRYSIPELYLRGVLHQSKEGDSP